MVICETAKFSDNVVAPLNEIGDSEGCTYVDQHTVKTPTGFKEAYELYNEGGWQGLVSVCSVSCSLFTILCCTDLLHVLAFVCRATQKNSAGKVCPSPWRSCMPRSWPPRAGAGTCTRCGVFLLPLVLVCPEQLLTFLYFSVFSQGLSKGAINTLYAHGDEALKQKYMHRMVSGEWTGTMCLTEPQCGSDLAQVSTKAIPQQDGSYKITGTKIFISCGEHDMTNNIIHCVLARLPNAPPGIKGISLFLVPKHKVSKSGDISAEFNGANIGRIEDKMGCHGSSTCEINFEDAEGYLIGTENKGMNHMFTFINTSRLGTSMQGVAAAENSYQNALAYCKERRSMRALNGPVDSKSFADPLIVHGDIRKNLLFQRAVSLGGRSMIYQCVKLADEVGYSLFFTSLCVTLHLHVLCLDGHDRSERL